MGYYSDLWRKQKETGTYQTRDGGTVTGKKKGSGANTVSSASANLGAGKATTTTTKSSSKSSGSKSSAAANAYKALMNSQAKTTPTLTYSAPTATLTTVVKPVKTPQTVASNIAANAYKKRMAAAQANRAYAYDDGYDESKNPNSGKEKSGLNTSIFELFGGTVPAGKQADYSGLEAAKTYTPKPQTWRDTALYKLFGGSVPATQDGYESVNGASDAVNSHNPYRTKDNIIVGTPGAANLVGMASADLGAKNIRNYDDYVDDTIADYTVPPVGDEAVVEEPEPEEEFEEDEELDPMEEYMQMILDAQAAQNAAQLQMLRNQSGVLNQQYDNNAANLYAQYRRSGLAMPELMAGTATGIADSLTLQNDLALQNNLAANELERAAAQNELNAQANQIQADADLQAAQTAAEWAKMAYQQRLANQNKSDSGNSGNSGKQETTTEPVAMMSSAEALLAARQYSSSYKQQLAYLQQLYTSGQISYAQYSDLKMALDPTLSYK